MPWPTVLGATSAYGPDAPLPSPGPHVIDPNTAAGLGSGGLGLAVHREKVLLPGVTLALGAACSGGVGPELHPLLALWGHLSLYLPSPPAPTLCTTPELDA